MSQRASHGAFGFGTILAFVFISRPAKTELIRDAVMLDVTGNNGYPNVRQLSRQRTRDYAAGKRVKAFLGIERFAQVGKALKTLPRLKHPQRFPA